MQPGDGFGQPFVVANQVAGAGGPGERAPHHPAPGRQDKAALGCGQLDHLQLDPMGRGVGSGLRAGLTLVSESDLNAVSRRRLHRLGQFPDLLPILDVGGGDLQGEQVSKRADRQVNRAALAAFRPVVAGGCPTFRHALGGPAVEDRGRRVVRAVLPHRSSTRRSCAMSAKQPASIPRRACGETAAHGGKLVDSIRRCTRSSGAHCGADLGGGIDNA